VSVSQQVKFQQEKAAKKSGFFDDEDFQDALTGVLVRDNKALQQCAGFLDPNDFKPLIASRHGQARWIVAERALEYFKKHRVPVGNLIRADVLEYCKHAALGADQKKGLEEYLEFLKTIHAPPDALVEKVLTYKGERFKAEAVSELISLQSTGELTDDKWREISRKALVTANGNGHAVDYLATMGNRQERRSLSRNTPHTPFSFIEPLDDLLDRIIGPGQVGLIMAPYKRGKSLMLLWFAIAYVMQRLNVLFITLEDPKFLVEDRLDAIVTHVPIKSLRDKPLTIQRHFQKFRSMVRAGLHVYDGTFGGITVDKIEHIIDEEREQGFVPNAVIVDYDAKIVAEKTYKEKRFESDETYTHMQQVASRANVLWWTAAQTQRDTAHLKIISGDKIADDINKVRNVTVAISMGKGEWTEDSIYLWIAAHKMDSMERGCEIVPDLDRMLIYSREKTRAAQRANGNP
jgi:hypothetical protein